MTTESRRDRLRQGSRDTFQRGAFAPAREEITAFDLPVTGSVPLELEGRYLRNGPNPIGIEHARFHYFLGAGMVHGVRLRGGRAEWYRSRWVRQAAVSRALREPRRIYPVLGGVDVSSNTNVVAHSGRILTLVEGGTLPFELDAQLQTIGPHDFNGGLRTGMTAHPKIDPMTGEMHSLGYFAGSGTVDYIVINTEGQLVRHEEIILAHSPMMHDFALTKKYVVLYDLPVTFNAMKAATGDPFPFGWNSRRNARIGVMPRNGCAEDIKWFEIDPIWIYHTVNAHDAGSGVLLDVITHPQMFSGQRASIIGNGLPALDRFELDLNLRRAVHTRLDETPQEFPRINDQYTSSEHRFVYTARPAALADTWRSGPRELDDLEDADFGEVLLKHDLATGRAEVKTFGRDSAVGEAVFVPRTAGTGAEDDGFLLTYVHDPLRGASDLVILSAGDFSGDELARIHLPSRVPLGLHGSWVPDAGH